MITVTVCIDQTWATWAASTAVAAAKAVMA